METITVAICEDHLPSLSFISQSVQILLNEHGYQGILSSFSSSLELYDLVAEGSTWAMYFLDIDMPQKNGLELAALIRKMDRRAAILFVSAKEEYVFEAIKARPFRFIRKSNFKEDLREAMEEYMRQANSTGEEYLTIQVQSEIWRFRIFEIFYVQAKDNYLDVVTEKKNMLLRYRISELEKQLEGKCFIRIHKSYLVNCCHIYRMTPTNVILENGQELPIGRSRRTMVQQKFKEYMRHV